MAYHLPKRLQKSDRAVMNFIQMVVLLQLPEVNGMHKMRRNLQMSLLRCNTPSCISEPDQNIVYKKYGSVGPAS